MFTVKPDDIKHFTGEQLVELLRVILYVEARKAGVPLRAVDVPLQITIADGGKDAHVLWEDGAASTDYFPGRDVVFQCKASDHGAVLPGGRSTISAASIGRSGAARTPTSGRRRASGRSLSSLPTGIRLSPSFPALY